MLTNVFRMILGFEQVDLCSNRLQPSQLNRLLQCCCLSLYLIASLWISPMAWADSTTSPNSLFETNCAGCHPNGANIIRRGKSLKQKALRRYGYDSTDKIVTLITNGKGLMSAYGGQLSKDDINSLANYVLEQAAINWKSKR